MKRIFSILAVAAVIVAACAVSSCKKSVSPIIGEWVNETNLDKGKVRKVTYTFTESGSQNTYTYYDGQMSGGNAGTYTFSSPTVTMSYTTPVYTETGTLNGSELTIETRDFGSMVFTKKQ